MLADICNWFAEGFDTADLKHAKALPGELGAKARSVVEMAAQLKGIGID